MKLIKEQSKKIKTELMQEYITVIEEYIVFVYLFCMLGIFPLYYEEKYYKIGDAKFGLFWNVSLGFIGISLVLVLIRLIMQGYCRWNGLDKSSNMKSTYNKINILYKEKETTKDSVRKKHKFQNIILKFLDNLSTLDYTVFIYAICVLLSYAFSDFKDYALKGAAGWEMGLCSQMFFVAIYFILSRQKIFGSLFFLKQGQSISATLSNRKKQDITILSDWQKLAILILEIHLIASGLTFALGILHRFDIDPLGMYIGLDLYQKIEFLSTIGQATWFSSYVCTVFAVGVILFYVSEKKWIRIITGIYSAISFGILVTQNSDSAFVAIAGIMFLLGYYSLSDLKKWCRFWQIICLMWGTFGGIGILQRIFADRAIPLDSLSIFVSQSAVTWTLFIVSLGMLFFYTNYIKKQEEDKKRIMYITKSIYTGLLFLLAVAIIVTVIFIYLNTKGYLLDWFGYQSSNQYLLFDYHWGNNRGSTWMVCWQGFLNLSWFQKLFGVGPDSLSAYLYSVPDISNFLHNLLGNALMTNAHNEYLNSLLCYGIVGAVSWLAALIGGIGYFYRKAKENPFMIAFALCIMGYACHNIFCYQQVCCTPFLFITLGIGESLTKSENFNTI